MRSSTRTLSRLFACIAAILLPGCGQREALDVAAPLPEQPGPRFIESIEIPASSAAGTTLSTSKAITTTDGGQLVLGKFKVAIPKLALSQNATVTLTIVDEEFAWIRVDAGTATLSKPLSLALGSLDQTDGGTSASLTWCRSSNGAWPTLASVQAGSELTASSGSFGDFKVGAVQAGSLVQWVRWLDGPGYSTEWVEASKGGQVKYGRYKLDIPVGALAQNTYITVRDPGSGYLECELSPHGLHFLVPVLLESDLSGTNYDHDYSDWTTWWLNEATGVWEDQGGAFVTEKVETELWHFSIYRPGRAGW